MQSFFLILGLFPARIYSSSYIQPEYVIEAYQFDANPENYGYNSDLYYSLFDTVGPHFVTFETRYTTSVGYRFRVGLDDPAEQNYLFDETIVNTGLLIVQNDNFMGHTLGRYHNKFFVTEDMLGSAYLWKEIIPPEGEQVKLGWLKMERGIVDVSDKIEVSRKPEVKYFETKNYMIGQCLNFAVINGTSDDLKFPLCFIDFPSKFKHIHTEKPESGVRSISSDLWGMSGQLTELREMSLERMELSSVLASVLNPGQPVRFFLRFDLPDSDANYKIQMKLKAEGKPVLTQGLILKVKV